MYQVETTMLKLEDIQPGFQLWITTEPHPKFPIGLLQMSIKVTNEAPAGVRAGLKASYAWVNQDMLDAVTQPQWKSMLYALCFMHTIVQERVRVRVRVGVRVRVSLDVHVLQVLGLGLG